MLGSNWIWTVPVLADEKTEEEDADVEEEAIGGTTGIPPPLLGTLPSSTSLMSTWMRASPVGEANSLCFLFLDGLWW